MASDRLGNNLRPPVNTIDIGQAFTDTATKLKFRLKTKGNGSYASRHEIYGILAEEMDELLDELRINSLAGYKNFRKELLDIAVAALFAYTCMDERYIKYHPKHKK
jgi:hypothetical protein